MASLIVRSKENKKKISKKEAYRGALWNGKDQFAETPTEVMLELVKEFGLLNDVCPRDPQRNGLEEEWQKINYMNPPYSQMEAWLTKAVVEWKKNKTVVCLLPARTNTNWFHDICIVAFEESNILIECDQNSIRIFNPSNTARIKGTR